MKWGTVSILQRLDAIMSRMTIIKNDDTIMMIIQITKNNNNKKNNNINKIKHSNSNNIKILQVVIKRKYTSY